MQKTQMIIEIHAHVQTQFACIILWCEFSDVVLNTVEVIEACIHMHTYIHNTIEGSSQSIT